ncbi:hypothetical protein ACT4MK_08135 [Bradyrhizobium barranii]|uniref:hypothetical protein n=1 Tax=Bradyrhizobium TaxID=374 RepID=UPI003F23ECBE
MIGKPQFHGPDEGGFRNYCNLLLNEFEIRVFLNDAEQIEYTAANPEEGWVRVIPSGNSLSARSTLKGFVEIRINVQILAHVKSHLSLLCLLLYGNFLLKPHALEFLCGLLALRGLLDAHEFAGRLVALGEAEAPPNVVFVCERFLTAPLRALSPTGLLTAMFPP